MTEPCTFLKPNLNVFSGQEIPDADRTSDVTFYSELDARVLINNIREQIRAHSEADAAQTEQARQQAVLRVQKIEVWRALALEL